MTIDLRLSVFPWANFPSTKAAVKMHTLRDLKRAISRFIHISNGKRADALVLDLITSEEGSIYLMDRAYIDSKRLYVIHRGDAFIVTRAKPNMSYHKVYSQDFDKTIGMSSDRTIALDGFYTKHDYPQYLQRISFREPETGKHCIFLTNNFVLCAETVSALHKKRWAAKLFFEWIKQNLRIKHFYRSSENAVKTQLRIAVCVYTLVAIIKTEWRRRSRSTLFYRFCPFTLSKKAR